MIKTVWRTAKLVPVVVAVEDLLYGPAYVSGRSMQPTLNPESATGHDLVLADKWSIKLYRYNRGDVVLLRCPFDCQNSKQGVESCVQPSAQTDLSLVIGMDGHQVAISQLLGNMQVS